MSALRIRFRHLLSLAQVEWHIKFTKVPFEATSSCNSKLQSAMINSPWSSKSTSPDCMVTVYALTFAGLNFRGFRGSIAIRESFIPRKFTPDRQRLCNCITNRKNKNAKTAKIGNPRKFNPVKIKAYTVYLYWKFTH